MKNLLVIASITCLLFGACKRNKVAKVSAKDTHISTNNTNSTTTITTVKTTTLTPKTNNTDTLRLNKQTPPQMVVDVFKVNYPNVNTVVWEPVSVPAKKVIVSNYKAYFIVNDLKRWVVYDEDGKWVESREQILPDQLPQNIFTAIKNRYPKGHIELATTYKHIKLPGTYAAFVKTDGNVQESEVILLENGSFVK
jgi:hypothetical protein